MPYAFWNWESEDDQRKRHAADFATKSAEIVEQTQRSQLQEHVGGLLEQIRKPVEDVWRTATAPGFVGQAGEAITTALDAPRRALYQAPGDIAHGLGLTDKTGADAYTDMAQRGLRADPGTLGSAYRGVESLAGEEVGKIGVELASDPLNTLAGAGGLAKTLPKVAGALGTADKAQNIAGAAGLGLAAGSIISGQSESPINRSAFVGEGDEEDSSALPVAGLAFGAVFGAKASKVVRGPAATKVSQSYGTSLGDGVARNRSLWEKTTEVLYEDLGDVRKVMNDYASRRGKKLADDENAYQILRLGRASSEMAGSWADDHVGEALKGLKTISGSVDQGTADLNDYMRAADAVDKAAMTGNPGRKFGGFTAAEGRQAIDEISARLGSQGMAQLEAAAGQFYKFGNYLLDIKVSAGLVSPELAAKLKATYPRYMPIQVLDWLDDNAGATSNRVGRVGGGANDIKELTDFGTERGAEEPIQAFLRLADRTAMQEAKNRAARAVVTAAADDPDLQQLIRPADNVTAQMLGQKTGPASAYARKPGEFELQFRVEGEIRRVYMDKSMESLVNFGVTTGNGPWAPMLAPFIKAANITRAANTVLSPAWGIGQVGKDSLDFLIRNGGFGKPADMARNVKRLGVAADEVGFNPLASRKAGAIQGALAGAATPDSDGETTWEDRARNAAIGAGAGASLKSLGLGNRANRGELYREARSAGALPGAIDRASGAPGSYDKIARQMTGRDDFLGWVKDGMIRNLKGMNESLDAIPRLAEYSRVKDSGGSMEKAALAARDVTIDPSRGGRWVRTVNAVIPFFNAGFQGTAQLPRMLANPETRSKAIMGMVSSVLLPTMAAEHYNRQDPRYKDVQSFDKDRGIVVMAPWDTGTDPVTGKPKPPYFLIQTGAFTPIVVLSRALYDASQGDFDPVKTAVGLSKSTSPVDVTSPLEAALSGENTGQAVGRTAASLMPSGMKQAVEVGLNYDTFRDRPLVPKALENLPTEQQFTENTSETAKGLSSLFSAAGLNVSPAHMDHLLRSWGGAADAVVGLSDATLNFAGIAAKGDSRRAEKLRRDLARTGITDEQKAELEGELAREMLIKADREGSLKNTPVVGGLFSRYYREQGGQSIEDREKATSKAVLDKRRSSAATDAEMKRLDINFGSVDDSISGVKLTRTQAATYRENALAYREKLLDALVKEDIYKQADDKTRGRLMRNAMTRAAGWASQDVLPGKNDEGNEFPTTGGIDKAVAGYLTAQKAKAEFDDVSKNERFRNIGPEDYEETVQDMSKLQDLKSAFGEDEGEMIFLQKYGELRFARASTARESRRWRDRSRQFREDNPDFVRFIKAGPQIITRRGLGAEEVAKLAGL